MDNRHAINQQHDVTTTVACQRISGPKAWLTHNLVAALAGTDFPGIKDFQVYLLATVAGVKRIITLDAHILSVYQLVDHIGAATQVHLINDLLHLGRGQRIIAQQSTITVVVKDDAGPIADQVFLGGLHDHFIPAVLHQLFTQRLFKIRFSYKRHIVIV